MLPMENDMANINKQSATTNSVALGSPRNYNEVVEFLDSHWLEKHTDKNLTTIKKLDQALGYPTKNLPTIAVSGTNGKGLTIHFATKLFQEEGLKVGALYSPHLLTYNERVTINHESISIKAFTDLANDVITASETHGIKADSLEILTMISLLHFKNNNVDVVLLEMSEGGAADPVNVCSPKILAITRITDETMVPKESETTESIKNMLEAVNTGTHVVSADQSKLNLQVMADIVAAQGGKWAMPIRKLAPLAYPFEQLHGRSAALAERICQLFMDDSIEKNVTIVANSLLAKQKGQRGRPTLEAKRQSELNPKKTLEQFWKDEVCSLPAHFQVLDKEKPTILLDSARNLDALKNLLLGIRLLHYQKPLKGITFVFGCDKNEMNTEEFLRLLRYFTKKNSAQIIFCPIEGNVPGVQETSWDVEKITNDVKSLKIKAKAAKNFIEAFELAKKTVDERNGLVVIAGSHSILSEYWKYKEVKKI